MIIDIAIDVNGVDKISNVTIVPILFEVCCLQVSPGFLEFNIVIINSPSVYQFYCPKFLDIHE